MSLLGAGPTCRQQVGRFVTAAHGKPPVAPVFGCEPLIQQKSLPSRPSVHAEIVALADATCASTVTKGLLISRGHFRGHAWQDEIHALLDPLIHLKRC